MIVQNHQLKIDTRAHTHTFTHILLYARVMLTRTDATHTIRWEFKKVRSFFPDLNSRPLIISLLCSSLVLFPLGRPLGYSLNMFWFCGRVVFPFYRHRQGHRRDGRQDACGRRKPSFLPSSWLVQRSVSNPQHAARLWPRNPEHGVSDHVVSQQAERRHGGQTDWGPGVHRKEWHSWGSKKCCGEEGKSTCSKWHHSPVIPLIPSHNRSAMNK